MTALGHHELREAMEVDSLEDRLIVTPLLDPDQVRGAAIDLRLGTEFLLLQRTRRSGIDPGKRSQADLDELQERVVIPFGEQLWLHPRHFVLAATLEYLALPRNLCANVIGRSSWGRLGLIVATAVFVHPGFHGCLTLELVNEGDSPIALTPGTRIAQLGVDLLRSPTDALAEAGKYYAPVRPEPSRLSSETAEFAQLDDLGEKLRSRLG
jgi:dCTP deaminase